MDTVAIVRCRDYETFAVEKAVREAVSLAGGLKGLVKKGDRVLLKPNVLTAKRPEEGVTTHPSVVAAVARMVMEEGGLPFIGDCSGSVFYETTKKALEESGIMEAARRLGIEARPLEAGMFRKVPVERGLILKEVYIANDVLDADVVIDLPKMKTHTETMMTGAVKNMFGCTPNGERKRLHGLPTEKFSKALVDIYMAARPKLAVMDAIIAMEGNGPSQGTLKESGLILASRNPAALDVAAARLMGFEPSSVTTIPPTAEKGLVRLDEDITIKGESLERARTKFKRPASYLNAKTFMGFMTSLASVRPFVIKEKCASCGVCVKSCPAEAIRIDGNSAAIDYNKCVKCYCCHELCPKGAV
ncbi:MAG: DUF362 domain-containing protein, partial [Candidatus Altiarchaeota archaeon]|nr:DUF362 domain-containing protein [Candidatus Altiarchaeota archaeon]